MTIADHLLGPLLAADPHVPRLVCYTADGRTELSTASLANACAKVAGLLADELALGEGDTASITLGPGWQTVPILLGCWWAGLTVCTDGEASTEVAFVPDSIEAQQISADDVFVVSGHPLGAPAANVQPECEDFSTAIRGQADHFRSRARVSSDLPALITSGESLTQDEVLAIAMAAADRFGPGSRVLSAAPWTLPSPGLDLVLGPLAAQGCLVAVIGEDDPVRLARLADDERAQLITDPAA